MVMPKLSAHALPEVSSSSLDAFGERIIIGPCDARDILKEDQMPSKLDHAYKYVLGE